LWLALSRGFETLKSLRTKSLRTFWMVVSSAYRSLGPGGCRKRHLRSGRTFDLSGMAKGYTGQMSMKTSAWKACSTVCQPTVRNASFTSGVLEVTNNENHLTKEWSEREERVAHPSVQPRRYEVPIGNATDSSPLRRSQSISPTHGITAPRIGRPYPASNLDRACRVALEGSRV
jgi:hypothetical protein